MKVSQFATALLSSTSALALTTSGFADLAENILANAPGYKPAVTFSDTYSEKIFTEDGSHDVEPNPEKLAAKVVANLLDFDFEGEISDDLPVELTIGGFDFSATLGDSKEASRNGFPAKGKKATFPITTSVEDRHGNPVEKTIGTVVFSWTAKTLTATLTTTDADLAGLGNFGAPDFAGLYEDDSDNGNHPAGSVKFDGVAIDVSVIFGSATGDRPAYGKGVSTTKNKRFGRGDDAEDFPTQSVTLTGSLDLTPPKVTGTIPTKDTDGFGEISFTLSVSDTPAPNSENGISPATVEIFLQGSDDPDNTDFQTFDPTEIPDSGNGPVKYDIDLGLLAPTTTITITVTDESGNATVITKKVTSTAF